MKLPISIGFSILLAVGFAAKSQARTCQSAFRPAIANVFFENAVQTLEREDDVLHDEKREYSTRVGSNPQSTDNWMPRALIAVTSRAIEENRLKIAKLISASQNPLFSTVVSMDHMHALENKVKGQIQASKRVPQHVIERLVRFALEIQSLPSDLGNTPNSHPRKVEIENQVAEFVANEPFFAAAKADHRFAEYLKYFAQTEWRSGTSYREAEVLLQPFVLPTTESQAREDDLLIIIDVRNIFYGARLIGLQ